MTTVPAPVADLITRIRTTTRPAAARSTDVSTAGAVSFDVSSSGVRCSEGDALLEAVEALKVFAGPAMAGPLEDIAQEVVASLNRTTSSRDRWHDQVVIADRLRNELGSLVLDTVDLLPVLGSEVVQLLARAVEAEALVSHLTAAVQRLGDQGHLTPEQVKDRLRRASQRATEESEAVLAGHFETWVEVSP